MAAMPPAPQSLPARWVAILTAATLAATVMGVLTFAQTASWPTALLAGIAAAGTTTGVLHLITGP
jgi:hypothetical protein